ncbi:hypothetical protein [Nocardioides sp. NPDC006273]|uniref:hypothetical protein n=1 Tax=Nocardioides sp. NPDC006273 TaxID=3155598 RepID=UPI0033A77563
MSILYTPFRGGGHHRAGGYYRGMNQEDALFGLGQEEPEPSPEAVPSPAQPWQIDQLRNALDATGVTEMGERQALIEELVGRPVAALRELHFADVRPVLEVLHARRATDATPTGSAWDQRDEDTWIDRI